MPTKSASDEAVLHLVSNLMEAWNTHDLDRAVSFYAPHYEGVDVNEPFSHRGPEGVRQSIARYLQAFPDLHISEDDTIFQGDRVAIAWTAQGTHHGRILSIPPTGRVIQVRGVSLLTVTGEKVSQGLYIWDVAGLLRSLGLLPEL